MLLGDTLAGMGPLTTPFRYGLLTNWAPPFSGQGVAGFRAVVQTFQITTSSGTELMIGLEPFDVSESAGSTWPVRPSPSTP